MINIHKDNITAVNSAVKLKGLGQETKEITAETIKVQFQMLIDRATNEMREFMTKEDIADVLKKSAHDIIVMPDFLARIFS